MAGELLRPQVAINEVNTGARPIEGVSTSTGAFVGKAEKGPIGTATLVTSFEEYVSTFGGFISTMSGSTWAGYYLTYAVYGFFSSGGKRAYIVRTAQYDNVTTGTLNSTNNVQASAQLVDRATGANVFKLNARYHGDWGNDVQATITQGSEPVTFFKSFTYDDSAGTFTDVTSNANTRGLLSSQEDDGGSFTDTTSVLKTAGGGTQRDVFADGSTSVANDAHYFGSDATFSSIFFDVKTAGVGGAATWEYFNGNTWVALGPTTDDTKSSFAWDNTGDNKEVTFAVPSDWSRTTINSTYGYWIRTRCTTAYSTEPEFDRCDLGSNAPFAPFSTGVDATDAASTALALDDTYYMGLRNSTFDNLHVDPQTAGSGTWTVTWQYWNGSTWADLSGVSATQSNLEHFRASSSGWVYWTKPTDWAKTDVNGSTAYWVRAKVSAFTSVTTSPVCHHTYPSGRFFDLSISEDGQEVERWEGLSTNSADAEYIGTIIGTDADDSQSSFVYITDQVSGGWNPGKRPTMLTSTFSGGVYTTDDGSGTSHLASTDYLGTSAGRTGLYALDEIDNINLVAIPDAAGAIEASTTLADVSQGILTYCEGRKDCFAILDPLSTHDATGVKDYVVDEQSFNSMWGAIYYPWIKVADPAASSTNADARRFVPPSGHVMGNYARTDNQRGVFKAPAGIDNVVLGAVDLKSYVTNGEHEILNPNRINAILKKSGLGIVVYGTRTLSADAQFRYIPVRRTLTYIEQSLLRGLQYAVFEPNDATLWSALFRDTSSFLLNVWRTGALQGVTPGEAFYVRSDSSVNPQSEIDAGRVHVQIGVAIVKPAEFVVVDIGLWDGGRLVSELG